MIQLNDTDRARFQARLTPTTEGCVLYAGKRDKDGYGIFPVYRDGRTLALRAHRLTFQLAHGPLPRTLHVLHRCDTPGCCNPAHLFLGRASENLRDMARKNRGTETRERPLGIRFHFNKWEAQVKIDGRSVYVGRFTSWQEAAALAALRRNEALFP